MKNQFLRVFLTLGLAFKILNGFGQTVAPLCTKFPDQNQGYFVFAKESYPTVNVWVLRIQEEEVNNTGKFWRDVQTIRTTQNFYRIPQIYMMPEKPTRILVNGYSNSGGSVGEDVWTAPPNPNDKEWVGKVRCVGPTYIWELQVYDKLDAQGNPTGGGLFQFTSGDGSINSAGIYVRGVRGFRQEHNVTWLSNYNEQTAAYIYSPKHHGYNYWVNGVGYNSSGARNHNAYFQMNNLTHNDNIRDDNSMLIVGDAWVVNKRAGYWIDKEGLWFETADNGSHYLSQFGSTPSVGWYNLINQKLGFNCTCNPIPSNGNSPGGNFTNGWKDWLDKLKAETAPKDTSKRKWTNPSIPVFTLLQQIHDEVAQEYGYEHDNNIPWWPANEITHLFVFPVSVDGENDNEPIIQISKHLLVNEDGSINPYNFGLEPGLYSVKLFEPDGGFVDFFFEVNEYAVQSFPLSSYLNVEIFPVPIVDNQTLTVKASSNFTMNYTYYLHSENGRQLDMREVRSKAEEEVEFLFDSNFLPSGLLFHKFVFEDGSELIYHTNKM